LRFGKRAGEGLVDDDGLARRQCHARLLGMQRVGRGDDDEVDRGVRAGAGEVADDARLREIRLHFPGITRHDGVQQQARYRGDQRRMEHLAREAITNERDVQFPGHGAFLA